MASHLETGKTGEEAARVFLEKKGLQILETNWRSGRAELDIIARQGGVLVFVEVKTRSTAFFGHPSAFVTPRKWRLLADAAFAYMQAVGHEWEFRFDIVSVIIYPGKSPRVEHFPDAYFPAGD